MYIRCLCVYTSTCVFMCKVYLTAVAEANSFTPEIFFSDYFIHAQNVRLFWAILLMVHICQLRLTISYVLPSVGCAPSRT